MQESTHRPAPSTTQVLQRVTHTSQPPLPCLVTFALKSAPFSNAYIERRLFILHICPGSCVPADSRAASASHCESRGAKVELILLDLLAKAAAHCLRAAETRLYPQKLTYFHFSPICFYVSSTLFCYYY